MILDPFEMLSAVRAKDHACKCIALYRLSRRMRGGNAGKRILSCIECSLVDNCRMCFSSVVLRKFPVVPDTLFLDMIVDI